MLDGLPSSLRIGAHDITILVVKDLKVDNGKCWGCYASLEHTIRLEAIQLNLIFAFDTVLHEINHAIMDAWYLQKGDSEERVASIMASGWTQVLRDNPALMEWMRTALGSSSSVTTTPKST
jgi:hypothetical protein